MNSDEIKALIEAGIAGAQIYISGDGCNVKVVVISDEFEGKSLIVQQRMVYDCLGDKITSGIIHALSIKSYTPMQWEAVPNKDEIV